MKDAIEWAESIPKDRQATDIIRGFCYQIWHAVHAWIDLKENQTLLIEGAEDFDIIEKGNQLTVQVKDKKASLTLRSDDAVNAINNFWSLKESHPDSDIIYEFITSSDIGIEQGKPLGECGGIYLWQNCKNESGDLDKIISFLKTDKHIKDKISPRVKKLLEMSSREDVYNSIISPIHWITKSDSTDGIVKSVEDKLVYHGNSQGISPSYCIHVCNRLVREMLMKATKSDCEERLLKKVDFLIIFEEETRIMIPVSLLNTDVLAKNLSPLSGADNDYSFSLTNTFHLQTIPPIPKNIYTRKEHIDNCVGILSHKGALLILGATGIGKTTLAKQVACAISSKWSWITIPEDEYSRKHSLSHLYHCLCSNSLSEHVILDNFNIDAALMRESEELLSVIFFQLYYRKHNLIITSQKDLPQRLSRRISITPECSYSLTGFSEAELLQYIEIAGCPKDQAIDRAKEIYIHTSRHPQLVHARVIALQQAGWHQIKYSDLFETPNEIKKEQSQAQQLLFGLTEDEKMLLYMCSLTTNPFYKDDIVCLANTLGIKLAGDIYDKLVGPYLEKTIGNTYNLTPLLKNSALNALTQNDIVKIHFNYANILIKQGELSIYRVSSIITHGIVGKNASALSYVALAIIRAPTKDRKEIAEYLDWFIYIKPRNNGKYLFPDNIEINSMLRNIQYLLAEIKSPTYALKIFEAWQKEIDDDDNTGKILFYVQVLLHYRVPIALKRIMELLVILNKCLIKTKDIKQLYPEVTGLINKIGLGIEASLMATNIQRINNLNDLNDYFDSLSNMPEDIRTKIISLFVKDISYIDLILNRVLWNERDAKRSDWTSFIKTLNKSLDYSKEWQQDNISTCILKYIGLIYHDQLNALDESIKILEKGKKQYPDNRAIFSEQLADIYIVKNKPDKALNEILEVPVNNKYERNCFKPKYTIFRKRGVIYAKLERWNDAALSFINAAEYAEKEELYVEQSALLGDAAFAYWHSKNYDGMDACLNNALKSIRPHYQGHTNIKALTTFRMVALVTKRIIYTLKGQIWENDSIEPWVGICSSSEPNEKLTGLPVIPIIAGLIAIGEIEKILNLPFNVLKHHVDMTDKNVPVNMMFSDFKLINCFRNNDYTELPEITYTLAQFMVSGKNLPESGGNVWDKNECNISEKEICDNECYNETIIYLMYSAIVSMLSDNIDYSIYQTWRNSINKHPIKDEIKEILTSLDVLSKAPSDVLLERMKSPNNNDKIISSIYLLKSQELTPPQMLQVNIYLYMYFTMNKGFQQLPEKALSYLISQGWIVKTNTRFLFNNPNIYIPQILELCRQRKESYQKIGELILCTASSIGSRLPDDLVKSIKLQISKER